MSTEEALIRCANALERCATNVERLFAVYGEIPKTLKDLEIATVRLAKDVEAHDRRLEDVEKDGEETGDIYLDDLKKKVESYEGEKSHWVHYAVAGFVTLLLNVGSAWLGYALKK